MAAPTSVSDLLELIYQSLPLDPVRLDAYVADLRRAAALPGKPGDLAALLVRDGFLTPFQAEHVMRGRRPKFIIGKYLVLDRIGAGGMGAVYFCEHLQLGRQVALKVLPADQAEDPAALARFHREAEAVAALNHPNIVRAYDVDSEGRTHFLVMEYVDGIDFQDLVARRGRVDPARAADYVRQAAEGLQHAHQARLVHRDVKPANLLLSRSGVVKVLDLGLARFFHEDAASLTEQHSEKGILGTVDYLSPEQARSSRDVDVRTDVYSLGATFYFLLTGRPPFADGSLNQKLLWHQMKAPPPVRKLRPDVPEAMAAVVARMMAKEPRGRYQTPAEAAAALAGWAQPPSSPGPEMPPPRPTVTAGRPWRTHLPSAEPPALGRAAPRARRGPSPSPLQPPPVAPKAPAPTSQPAAPPAATPLAAAATAPPPSTVDDWSSLFDDVSDTAPLRGPPTPGRSGKRGGAPFRVRWQYLAGAGVSVLLLVAVCLILWSTVGPPKSTGTSAAPPPTPQGPSRGPVHLRAAVRGTAAVELTWEDPGGPSSGFRVERATDSAFTQNVVEANVAGDAPHFTDAKLTPGDTYYYRVRAQRGPGLSEASNAVSAPAPLSYAQGFTVNGLALNGGAAVTDRVLRLTDQTPGEARSAFYRQEMDVRAFSTKFRFRITPADPNTADGFTFCIQGGEPTAVGMKGGGLGYQGIPRSMAVKFDLFSNDGEGSNSTGVYLNGDKPSAPNTVRLGPAGIDLHSGRACDVAIVYKDGKLNLVISDAEDANRKASVTAVVDVPATVGGPKARVGFTGGTGDRGAVQDILSWTWESTAGE